MLWEQLSSLFSLNVPTMVQVSVTVRFCAGVTRYQFLSTLLDIWYCAMDFNSVCVKQ